MIKSAIKARPVGDKGEVSAVFATLGVVDEDADIIMPGAVTARADDGSVVISAYQHASWASALPVGLGRIFEQDDELVMEGQFFMDLSHASDTFEVVKRLGELQEWSFSLEDIKGERDDSGIRVITSTKVKEVSPVLRGAGINTRTLATKEQSYRSETAALVESLTSWAERTRGLVSLRRSEGKNVSADRFREVAEALDAAAKSFVPEVSAEVVKVAMSDIARRHGL